MHKLLVYGMGISAKEQSEDKIRFDGDKYLYCQGKELDIDGWRRFLGDILRSAERIVSRELLFLDKDVIDPINPYAISEDQSCNDNRYFFGSRIRGYKDQARETILKNIENRIQDWTTVENGWKAGFVSEYARAQDKFLEHKLVGLNIVRGLTERGTEILSLLYKNVAAIDRDILLQARQIVVTT